MSVEIIPTIMAADIFNLSQELEKLSIAGIRSLHVDIDVTSIQENSAIGIGLCKSISAGLRKAEINVCIFGGVSEASVVELLEIPAQSIAFHVDSVTDWKNYLKIAKRFGCKVGLAISLDSSDKYYIDYLDGIDRLVILAEIDDQERSKLIIEKISRLRSLIDNNGFETSLFVDNISDSNIQNYFEAGANGFIVGCPIFDEDDYYIAMSRLRKKIEIRKNR